MDKGFSVRAFLPELVLIIAIGALLFFNVALLDIDPYSEFFHLEAAKESLAAGRFWTPLLNGHDYLARPPLWTWIVTGFFKLMGVSLYAARFPAILLSISALVLLYMTTLSLTKSRFSGFLSVAVLATSWGFFQLASLSTADILGLNLYLGFMWTLLQWKDFASRRNVLQTEINTLSLTMGILLGILMLSSGTASVLMLLVIALSFLLITQSTLLLNKLNYNLLCVPALLIPLPWLVWASIQSGNAAFIFEYLLVYPIQKLFGGGMWQSLKGDSLFYVKRLSIDFLPWLLFMPVAFLEARNFTGRDNQQAQTWMNWLLGWFLLGLITLSLAVFQEPTQMLPFMAPIAIMIGYYLGQVVESAGGKAPEHYEKTLTVYIGLMMAMAVFSTIVIFQVVPSNYVEGFWHLPGMAVIESFTIKDHLIEFPEAIALWKFWLIPGPFVLLIGGFTLFVLQAGRKLTLTPIALASTMAILLLFVKTVYLPIMHRPVPQQLAQQMNQTVKPADRILLYSFAPDVKRVLFFLDTDKLPQTEFSRDKNRIAKHLEQGSGVLYGVIRERSFFEDLGYGTRSLLRVNQYNWRWDTDHLSELRKLFLVRLPNFDKMKSELIYFQTLPAETVRTLREEASHPVADEKNSSGKRKKRR